MSGATDALDLDRQICFPLYAATRAVTRRYTEVLADVGLTYPQYLVMLALWTDGALSVGELGRRLRLDSGTLTPLLKRLEAGQRTELAARVCRHGLGTRDRALFQRKLQEMGRDLPDGASPPASALDAAG